MPFDPLEFQQSHLSQSPDLRDFLTGYGPYDELVESIATSLSAEQSEIRDILQYMTLNPENQEVHLRSSAPSWAPLIRTSQAYCVLPTYGIDINPFLFLWKELRRRHEREWSMLFNLREARWISELMQLFPGPRWQATERGIKIKRGAAIVTDIDFAALDKESGELALFQLKWQQPVAGDHRARRSNAKNLFDECNEWITKVQRWIDEFGVEELCRRIGMKPKTPPRVHLFVLGRYATYFSGYNNRSQEATWCDWGNFQKNRVENPSNSVSDMASSLSREIASLKEKAEPESTILLLPGLCLTINPSEVPAHIRSMVNV